MGKGIGGAGDVLFQGDGQTGLHFLAPGRHILRIRGGQHVPVAPGNDAYVVTGFQMGSHLTDVALGREQHVITR